MCSSKDSFSIGQPIFFTREEIASEGGVDAYNANSHEVNNPSQMPVASFGDSTCALKLARLIDCWIDSGISDQRLMGLEVSDIADLSQECSTGRIPNTIDGSEYAHFFDHHGLTEVREDVGNLIEALHKVQGNRYLLRQDKLLGKAIGGDGAFCRSDKLIGTDGDLSAFAEAFQSVGNSSFLSCPDTTRGGEFLEETKHRLRKDVCQGFQLWKCSLQNPFDLVFGGSDKMGYGLPLPGEISEIFQVLRDRQLSNGVFVSEKEPSYCEGVFLIGFGFSQGQLCEIGYQKGIKDYRVDLFGGKKREKIDMVAACGLHGGADRREITTSGFNSFQQSRESYRIHGGRERKPYFSFEIDACSGKGILGYVNTDKQSIHRKTSLKYSFSKAGKASRPNLHGDKDSAIQSTYHGYGRQGTDSFKDSTALNKWSSPAFPSSMGKTHLSINRYNTNSM